MDRFFASVNENVRVCGLDNYDPNKVYYSVSIVDKTHWNFNNRWQPLLNEEIRQWLAANGIINYNLRKTPDPPDWPLNSPLLAFQIDFENPDDAILFKLTWCGE